MKILIITLFISQLFYTQQILRDTIVVKKITYKELIIPKVLIGYNAIGIKSDGLKFVNSGIKGEINENIDKKITIDYFSQYAPTLSVYGLHVLGIKGEHNFKDRTLILGTSYLIMLASVLRLKSIVKVERPDG